MIFEEEIAASEAAEREAKGSFFKHVSTIGEGLKPEEVWNAFTQDFLGPLIKLVGANAYRLVAGEKMEMDKALVNQFVEHFPSNTHSKLRELVTTFLDPKHAEVRAYISRMLHARFCVEASGLAEDVLEKLNASVGKKIRFQMFVDTNFLFSLLDLHENPSNSAAQELRELIDHLKGNPRIELVITPETIDEAKSAIASTKGQLSGFPSGRNFSEAALQGGFSGMTIRFLTERVKRNGNLTAEDWFDPYLKNFVAMARGKGVELFNQKLDGYSTRQDVVDDIHLVLKLEERRPENRRKSYPKVAHDMVLWHVVNDKRPAYIESPIEAIYWILTVDFRLIGFDEHKQKQSKSKVPLCIHPASLIQLLQFWVPRTKEFEEAMLGSLRLPFLFQDFDVEGEKTSLKILKGIGRFEGSEGLSQETITQVMLNDGLRTRLQAEQSEEGEVALIRDALVEEIRLRAEAEANKAIALQAELEKRDFDIAILAEQKRTAEVEINRAKKDKDEADAAARLALASQKDELGAMEGRLRAMEDADRERIQTETIRGIARAKSGALWLYVVLLAGVVVVANSVAWWLVRWVPELTSVIGIYAARTLIGVVVFILFHLTLELSIGRKEPMSALWPFKQVTRFRGWLWSLVILGFVLGVFGNLVANRIQRDIDRQGAAQPNANGAAESERP